MRGNKLLKFPLSRSGLFTQHHGDGDILPKGFVGHCESDRFRNPPMMQDDVFDFARSDLFAAPVDHFFQPPCDEEISIGVEITLVAGSKPTTFKMFVGGLWAV